MLYQETLNNGMTLLAEPRTSLPVTACWLRMGVGAADEEGGAWGAAHFVEHMIFKGTSAFGVGDLVHRIEAVGGDLNAYTTHEETVVHCALPSEGVEEALSLLCDMVFRQGERASSMGFQAEDVERERKVVLDEIRGGLDDAGRTLGEAVARRCWTMHPYGRPIIGVPPSVEALRPEELSAFHARWYLPSNASLTVVGDCDPERLRELLERRVSGMGPAPDRPIRPTEPPQVDLRLVRVGREFQQQMFDLALRIPGHNHPDLPAIDLLVSILGEGAGSLLPSRLKVREKVILGAWADCEVGRDGGLATIGFYPAEGRLDDAISRLGELLREIVEQGVSPEAFHRARTAILADRVYQGETVEGRAATLSWYHGVSGSPEAEATYRARILTSTPADVQEVARRTLRLDRATVGMLGPDTDYAWEDIAERLLRRSPPRGFRPRRFPPVRAQGEPRVQRRKLRSGLTILVESDPSADTCALHVEGLGGVLLETSATAGHTRAFASLLVEGAGDFESTSFARAVESLAGSMRASSDRSTFSLSAVYPADRFHLGLQLALAPLRRPRFEVAALDRVRDAMIEELRTRDDDPWNVAVDEVWALMYPGHPYRIPRGGTTASLERLTIRRMRDLHERIVRQENLVVAVAGAVDARDVADEIEAMLSGLPPGDCVLPPRESGRVTRRRRRVRGDWEEGQVHVAWRGCTFRDEDRHPLEVLATVLGGQGGRLFMSLREEQALSYGVAAINVESWDPGAFICSMDTSPDGVETSRRALLALLDELVARPPDAREVERARAVLMGATLLDLQRPANRARTMAEDERFGLDGTRYRENLLAVARVSAEDLRRCIKERLSPEARFEVVLA